MPTLTPGAIVTTSKNDVDYIVTEFGIAKLRGKPLSERAKALISIAHPNFRDELTFAAKEAGYFDLNKTGPHSEGFNSALAHCAGAEFLLRTNIRILHTYKKIYIFL